MDCYNVFWRLSFGHKTIQRVGMKHIDHGIGLQQGQTSRDSDIGTVSRRAFA